MESAETNITVSWFWSLKRAKFKLKGVKRVFSLLY